MRKVLGLTIGMILSMFLLVSCQKAPEKQDVYKGSISDLTTDVLEGVTDNFTVTISIGEREKQPSLDGKCGEKQTFFMIRVMPTKVTTQSTVEYKLTAGDKTYNGVLPKALSTRGYMQDLEKSVAYDKEMDIELIYGDVTETVKLKSVIADGMLDYEQAVAKLTEKYGEKITELTNGQTFNGEIIVRLISDKKSTDKHFYWYMAIVDGEKNMSSCLVDATSGEFAA